MQQLILNSIMIGALLFPQLLTAKTTSMTKESIPRGSYNLQMVEDLALFYAEESIRKLRIPLTLRVLGAIAGNKIDRKSEVSKLRSNPPKANEIGVVYPFGAKNPLSFEYNADKGSLVVWERIIYKRGSIGFYGLTAIELANQLNQNTSIKKDRAGADFAYDSNADALSLRREYTKVPKDKNKFYKEIDHLLKIQNKWTQSDRFIKAAIAASQRNKPPVNASSEKDGFTATLALRHFSVEPKLSQFYIDRYVKSWDRIPTMKPPMLVSDRRVKSNQVLNGFIHFMGSENSLDGTADVMAEFKMIDPSGEIVFEMQRVQLWNYQSPPLNHLQIGENNISINFDAPSKLGDYIIEAKVCDQVNKKCVDLIHTIELF
jgi:hypothetical protein